MLNEPVAPVWAWCDKYVSYSPDWESEYKYKLKYNGRSAI